MSTHPLRVAADAALDAAHKSHFDTLVAAAGQAVVAALPDVDRFTIGVYVGPDYVFVDSIDVGDGPESPAAGPWATGPVGVLLDGLELSARTVLGDAPGGQYVWTVEVQPATGSWARLAPQEEQA